VFGGADAESFVVASVFAVLCWVALVGVCGLHRLVTTYRDHEEVAAGDLAAALSSAGLHLGVALVVAASASGPFEGWDRAVPGFLKSVAWVAALYPFRQWIVARVVLGMTRPISMRGSRGIATCGAGASKDSAISSPHLR
jgi:uncharacterized membrane protein YjfL (UPF0719 family)